MPIQSERRRTSHASHCIEGGRERERRERVDIGREGEKERERQGRREGERKGGRKEEIKFNNK